jgi:hypothetical protein
VVDYQIDVFMVIHGVGRRTDMTTTNTMSGVLEAAVFDDDSVSMLSEHHHRSFHSSSSWRVHLRPSFSLLQGDTYAASVMVKSFVACGREAVNF